MIGFTHHPEVTRYCSACGRVLVARRRWAGRFDQDTGEPRYKDELVCPYLALPMWYRVARLSEFFKMHDEVQVWEAPRLENRPVSRPHVPPSEDTRQ